jgi:two-component system LytT family sensor kinase
VQEEFHLIIPPEAGVVRFIEVGVRRATFAGLSRERGGTGQGPIRKKNMKHVSLHNPVSGTDVHAGRAFQSAAGRSWAYMRGGRVRLALLALAAWTAVGMFQAVPEMLRGIYWPLFASKLIDVWSWALLTPAILLIDRRLTSGQPSFSRLAGIHLLLSVPTTLVHTLLTSVAHYPFEEMWWSPLRTPEYAKYYFVGGWMTYCAFIAIVQAFKFYERLATSQFKLERVEKRLLASHLNALRLQLEPHFLFNALNAISSEVAENPDVSREMIEDLATLLRRSLDSQGAEITLTEELALLDHYLSIQKRRFGNRIRVDVEMEPAIATARVPPMLLQPLVENAIRHGLEGRLSGGTVAINAYAAANVLHITVVDDGIGLPGGWRMEACGGLGVRVTRERLEALYPDLKGESFGIARRSAGGTEVSIRIPLNRSE